MEPPQNPPPSSTGCLAAGCLVVLVLLLIGISVCGQGGLGISR